MLNASTSSGAGNSPATLGCGLAEAAIWGVVKFGGPFAGSLLADEAYGVVLLACQLGLGHRPTLSPDSVQHTPGRASKLEKVDNGTGGVSL